MKTILAIDDEPHMLHLVRYTLGKTGCRVLGAASGEAAIQTAVNQPIDLVVCDVMLTGIDGFETIRALRQCPGYARLPAILLTARGQSDLRIHALSSHVHFMTKPFSPIELRRLALELLEGVALQSA